jgi:hypothetical protein
MNETIDKKFEFIIEEIDIRLESLKYELDNLATKLKETLELKRCEIKE